MGVILGVDLGGTFIKAGLVQDGSVVRAGSRETEASRGADAVVENIINLCRKLLIGEEDAVHESDVDGVCVAVPSPISADRRTPVAPPNLRCLNGVAVAERVARAFGCPGVLENDANAAAFGEKCYGAAQGLNDFVTLTLGTGLGGGVFSEGRILRGRDNLAGEVGHLVVQPENGRVCGCGAEGCVEAYVSIRGLLASARETCEHLQIDGQLLVDGERIDETNGPVVLARLARAGDERVRQIFQQMGRYLGIAVSDLLSLLGPELIILSGGISNAFDLFENALRDSIRKHCGFKALRDPLRIEVSKIKHNAAILGAAAAFIESSAAERVPAAASLSSAKTTDSAPSGSGPTAIVPGAPSHARHKSSFLAEHPYTLPIPEFASTETVLAVQIGSTRTRAALVQDGRICGPVALYYKRTDDRSPSNFRQIMEDAARLASEACEGGGRQLSAVVVIVPCGVDRKEGRFYAAPGLPELGGHALGDTFASFGVSVFLESDANAALLFDYHYGNTKNIPNVVSLHLVYGVGGAAIIEGRLLHGRHGHATQFGHLSLDCFSGERVCVCRQVGCWEQFASGRTLERQGRVAEGEPIPEIDGNYMDVIHAARSGHPGALRLVNEFAANLAKGTVGLFTLFDPPLVLFTGALSEATDMFQAKIHTELENKTFWEYAQHARFQVTMDPRNGELRAASLIAAGIPVEGAT